ncbi:10612_t:CDS:2, partial [Dentiscutata heterogama]
MKFLPISSLFVFMLLAFSFVSAQLPLLPTNLSTTCNAEITKLSTSELSTCASPYKLLQQQITSITDPKSALDSYCSAPKCSDSATSTAATELQNQCATELTAKNPQITVLKEALVLNSPTRDSLCFKNSSGGYCGLDSNTKKILGYISGLSATAPTDFNCTDCNKAILNTFMNYFKDHSDAKADLPVDITSFQNSVTSKCGASYLDGNIPSTTTTTNPASSQKSS